MATALSEGVRTLEGTMRLTLAILALASGVYTYLGVRELLDGDATVVFFAAVIYSAAVSVGIYAFWSFMMRFLPHVRDNLSRLWLGVAMLIGSAMIVAMSSWLNAAALAGSAALEQHLATSLQSYARDLDKAHNDVLAAQGLLPDIQLASGRFAKLAEAERAGSLTGTAGSGTVVQLLTQMSVQLDGLGKEVTASGQRAKALYEQGGKHLAAMRNHVSSNGPLAQRGDAFGTEAMALIGVIASMQQTSVAPAVKRAADDLARGFIAPAAGGRDADLAQRQSDVVGRVEGAVAAQAASLAAAAQGIIERSGVEPSRFQPLSPAEAVLRYARDFVPSWAGAISIDLMPAVLVLILCVVHAGIRREGEQPQTARDMSAADLIAAMRLIREVETAQSAIRTPPAADVAPPIAPAAATATPGSTSPGPTPLVVSPDSHPAETEKVTPFAPSRSSKKE